MSAGNRPRVLAQLLQFPIGRLDDAVDMAALMALAIDQANSAIVKPEPQQERPPGTISIQEWVDRFEARQGETRRI